VADDEPLIRRELPTDHFLKRTAVRRIQRGYVDVQAGFHAQSVSPMGRQLEADPREPAGRALEWQRDQLPDAFPFPFSHLAEHLLGETHYQCLLFAEGRIAVPVLATA
jgi:hypothetical protein